MKKFLYSMEKLFHFLHFFHFFPRLNRKTRFSRSEILKNLNICPSKDRHLTCYTCYRFYDFLQYGLMDLVKSFFKWCMIYNFNRKSQKAPMSCHFIPEIMIYRQIIKSNQLLSIHFVPLYQIPKSLFEFIHYNFELTWLIIFHSFKL